MSNGPRSLGARLLIRELVDRYRRRLFYKSRHEPHGFPKRLRRRAESLSALWQLGALYCAIGHTLRAMTLRSNWK